MLFFCPVFSEVRSPGPLCLEVKFQRGDDNQRHLETGLGIV